MIGRGSKCRAHVSSVRRTYLKVRKVCDVCSLIGVDIGANSTTMEWGNYLARGPYVPFFHMCNETYFNDVTQNGKDYYPPTFAEDGNMIHATEDPRQLMDVGNHFYKNDVGAWICLELDPYYYLKTVVWESASGVGKMEAMKHEGEPVFPHIYGSIPLKSIVKKHPIVRGDDGTFITVTGLLK